MRALIPIVLALPLACCQGTAPTYGYQPIGTPTVAADVADAQCLARAAAAKRAASSDIWAQGGEPAYHRTYAQCMAGFGWKRVVTRLNRYG
jgi:hypothetical protein